MRGDDPQAGHMFSYLSPEQRVPADHPLRPIRQMTDVALQALSPRFARMYSRMGRPSITPEKLLRALLLQVLYSVRSERQLMEQLDYNLRPVDREMERVGDVAVQQPLAVLTERSADSRPAASAAALTSAKAVPVVCRPEHG